MRYIYFAYAITLLILNISCTKDKQDSKEEALLPLKIGNQWEYVNILYNEDGSVEDSSIHVMSILQDTAIKGRTYFFNGLTFLRNSDLNTVEESTDGKEFYVVFKRVETDRTSLPTGSGIVDNCIANATLTAFTGFTDINGHQSLRNDWELKNCYGVLNKKVSYLNPGVGMTKTLLYLRSGNSSNLYLRFKQELKSYSLH